ncbi:benzoate/H(+) symporter BenE family transporter [Halopseudomonas sp.]|uniref:benzoate/H(+) symporter BenE family transporter n=1 Tax=Halopseudomonas sp. TaxID=2901191 RepID=UPI001A3F0631|nr:benzoate/H(+) symporter BenE family transporter [Pseudomonas sp.]|tara:strand:- start:3711 stop:4916 length:1206 start_codon:yes stop_codon:yes gene_type:complete
MPPNNSQITRTTTPSSPLRDSSASTFTAGFIAMLTGYSSSVVLMIQAGQAASLTPAQIASWIWALSLGMAVCTIALSLRYRMPLVVVWSTPGAALLITSLPGVTYSDAIGAFMVCGLMLLLSGVSTTVARLMRWLPASLAAALLAGILFRIGSQMLEAAQDQIGLVLLMLASYLVGKRWLARYAVLLALAAGTLTAWLTGMLDIPAVHWQLTRPVWTAPTWSLETIISISLPLYIVAMTSQNLPGLAILKSDGYEPNPAPLLSLTGIASVVLAPFGSHGINLAAISAAVCTGAEAHPDPGRRYTAALWCGIFFAVIALFSGTLAIIFMALPQVLVITIAALALLGSIAGGLAKAMELPREREVALLVFLITASGFTLFSIGAAFWGLVAGLLAWWLLPPRA